MSDKQCIGGWRRSGPAVWLLLFGALCFPPEAVQALDDAQIVQGLEALGDYAAAYPLALELARQRDDYRTWRELAANCRAYGADDGACREAWRQARRLDQAWAYRDFLALRPGSVLHIHWSDNRIVFRAMKNGKDTWLPLTEAVGEALLEYLQQARPACACPQLFLTSRTSYRPLSRPSTVSEIV